MKRTLTFLLLTIALSCGPKGEDQETSSTSAVKVKYNSKTQDETDKKLIEEVCMNYIEGFYLGDTTKIIASLKPSLYKYGYWKDKDTGKYNGDSHMSYRQAIDYAKNVLEREQFAKSDAPKRVEVLDIMNHIAAVKITAWWGEDYLLLSRTNDGWVIEQALWEGPLEIQ